MKHMLNFAEFLAQASVPDDVLNKTALILCDSIGAIVGFIALLGFVAASGLVLYILGQTTLMPLTLAAHLGAVLTFFLLTPYTKMVHGIYRFAALVRDEQRKTGSTSP
jgi:hypothetical protein